MRPTRRWPYLLVAYACIALAAVGVFVPGLPTTPFLLLAAWAAARGSARLHGWLWRHRRFGPLLRAWQEQGAIPTRAKWATALLLPPSWALLAWRADGWLLPGIVGAVLVVVGAFVFTRPAPRARPDDLSAADGNAPSRAGAPDRERTSPPR